MLIVLEGSLRISLALMRLGDLSEDGWAACLQSVGCDAQVFRPSAPATRVVDKGKAELLSVAVIEVRLDAMFARSLVLAFCQVRIQQTLERPTVSIFCVTCQVTL